MKRSLSNILKWFGTVKGIATTVTAVISLTFATIGGIKAYNAWVIRQHDKTIADTRNQQAIISRLDSLQKGQAELKGIVSGHTEKLDGVARSQATLKNIVTKEFAKTMTPQQVLEMMEQFEIKKNNGFTNEIRSEGDNILIPYTLK